MSTKAKLYIHSNVVAGAAVLVSCLLFAWQTTDPLRYVCYLALAMVAAGMKVQLPGLTGTISLHFFFVLIALADFGFSETVLMATAGGMVQSLWKRMSRPKLIQVAFNTAVLATSAAFAFSVGRLILADAVGQYRPLMLCLTATLYFFSNTFLVCGVIALVQGAPLTETWHRCHLWAFPYYLAGAAIAGVMSLCNQAAGWRAALFILPGVYLCFVFYRQCVRRLASHT